MQAFFVFSGKELGQIFPGYPRIGILANSCVIICTNFVKNWGGGRVLILEF